MSFNDIQKFARPEKGNCDDRMFVSDFQKLQPQLVPWHDKIDNLAKSKQESNLKKRIWERTMYNKQHLFHVPFFWLQKKHNMTVIVEIFCVQDRIEIFIIKQKSVRDKARITLLHRLQIGNITTGAATIV